MRYNIEGSKNRKKRVKIRMTNSNSEFGQYIGMHLRKQENGEAEVELTVEKHHLNSQNIVHGGVLLSMMDLAMGAAASSFGGSVVTMDVQYRFFRPAHLGDSIVAQGHVLKNGKTIAVTKGTVYSDDTVLGEASGQFFKRD